MQLTMPSVEDMLGTIDAVRVKSFSGAQKSAIVWTFMDREVWLDEVPAIGRKRALYAFHKRDHSAALLRKIWCLEAEAHEAMDRIRESENECDAPEGHATVIESDPFVLA